MAIIHNYYIIEYLNKMLFLYDRYPIKRDYINYTYLNIYSYDTNMHI